VTRNAYVDVRLGLKHWDLGQQQRACRLGEIGTIEIVIYCRREDLHCIGVLRGFALLALAYSTQTVLLCLCSCNLGLSRSIGARN
jgi:hypothetical protein